MAVQIPADMKHGETLAVTYKGRVVILRRVDNGRELGWDVCDGTKLPDWVEFWTWFHGPVETPPARSTANENR